MPNVIQESVAASFAAILTNAAVRAAAGFSSAVQPVGGTGVRLTASNVIIAVILAVNSVAVVVILAVSSVAVVVV
jgi:hypothetical protein